MNWEPEPVAFHASLKAWAWRGGLCAAPSFVWAGMAGFQQPMRWAEMVLGVATYVLWFAWITALPVYVERVQAGNFGWALRMGANIRAALAPLLLFGPDGFLGALAIAFVDWVRGGPSTIGLEQKISGVGWTYATTIVQGALVSATMLLLALVIWGVRVGLKKGGLKPRPTFQGTS